MTRRHCRFAWGMLFGWCCAMAVATAHAADRAGLERVRFQRFGVDDGLSQASVRAITQDSQGFIWLGTQDGLNRYDGYEFRVLRRGTDDPHSLPDNHVQALAPGADGSVYVGTQNGGLALYRSTTGDFKVWPAGDPARGELASNPVTSLLSHRWGGLWVASGEGHLQRLEADDRLVDIAGPVSAQLGSIRGLAESSNGWVLIAAASGPWRVAADGTGLAPLPIDGGLRPSCYDIVESFDGSVWIATEDQGLWHVDLDGRLLRRLGERDGLPEVGLRAVTLDRAGRLWLAALGGLSLYDPASGALQTWSGEQQFREESLSGSRVESLFEDREGLMWAGTWVNGVNLHDPRVEALAVARPVVGHPRALPGYAATAVVDDGQGGAFIALQDAGQVVRFSIEQGVQQRMFDDETPLPMGSSVRALARNRDGTLWVGLGGRGLMRFRPGERGRWFQHDPADPESAPGGDIFHLYVDREDTLWISSIGGGLASICAGCDRFRRYQHRAGDPQSLPGDEINHVFEGQAGGLWIGSRFHGLLRLDRGSGRLLHYPARPGQPDALSHPSISFLTEDRAGQLWIGTQGGGLFRAERNGQDQITRFQHFDRGHGLGSDAIGALIEDRAGQLWVSTTVGLSRLDPESGEILSLGARDGALQGGYYIGSAARLADGSLTFGGPRGLSVLDPRDVQSPPAPRRVVASEIRIAGRSGAQAPPLTFDDGGRSVLVLPVGTYDFTVDLSALSFSSPDQIVFEYRIDPLDQDWVRTDSRRRFAAFSNLAQGNYLFRARALRPGAAVSEELQLPVQVTRLVSAGERLRNLAVFAAIALAAYALLLGWQRQRERAAGQRLLAASEQRLKLALWGSGDELWDLDVGSGVLRRENPITYVRSLGESEVGDAGQLRQFVHPDDLPVFDRGFGELLKGLSQVLDVTVRVAHVDGGWVWLRSRGRVAERSADGRAIRVTGTTSDVSELRSHQAALEQLNQELEQRVSERTRAVSASNRQLERAVQELRQAQGQLVQQEKMAALGGLVAGVAHEINTPLGIGVTTASHLDQAVGEFRDRVAAGKITRSDLERFTATVSEASDLILRNLNRAAALVRSFKQVAVDQSSESRRRFDLAAYVEEVLTSLRPTLKKAGHQVVNEIPAGIEVDTYPGAIYHIVSNLLQNSLVHGFAGRDTPGRLRLSGRVDGEQVVLDYSDDGIGMSEDVRRRIFEPFFTTRRGSGGSGLGMHIVFNNVTQVLGGSIVCDSSPGRGVRFELRLPINAPQAAVSG